MLDWFNTRAFDLPGASRRPYAEYDTATFRSIYTAARLVDNDCLYPSRRPGWESAGTKSNLGVFLWATDSEINGQVMGTVMGVETAGVRSIFNTTGRSGLDESLR